MSKMMKPQEKIKVSEFLRTYESKNTRKNYKTGLKAFFKVIYPDSSDDLDTQSLRYLDSDRNYREDIQTFRENLSDKAPMTVTARLNSIRCFLDENGIEFNKKFFKRLNGKVKEAISKERVPKNDELRRIIEYLPVQGKALALVLSSSGMRVAETLKLKLRDIDMTQDLIKITIRAEYTKTGKRRIVFISQESRVAIEEWLKYRDQYIVRAKKRTHKNRKKVWKEQIDNLFPFSSDAFAQMWLNALTKAQLLERDVKTKRISMRPHNLRKFFRRRVGRFGRDEAEALLGHQTGLNLVYADLSDEEGEERLLKVYKQAEPDLSVYGRSIQVTEVSGDFIEMKNRIEKLEKVNSVLRDEVTYLTSENVKLEDLVARVTKIEQAFFQDQ